MRSDEVSIIDAWGKYPFHIERRWRFHIPIMPPSFGFGIVASWGEEPAFAVKFAFWLFRWERGNVAVRGPANGAA